MIHDRARGALLGLAVGDAFGTTLEFSHPPPRPFAPLLDGPHVEITGGGPFGVLRGQVTDDSQMAACIAASLAARGRYDALDVAKRYEAWSDVAFDIGAQTSSSIERFSRGLDPHEAGIACWVESKKRAAGNGSLMRISPIAVFFAGDAPGRLRATLLDSLTTHADPRCIFACAALNGAVAHALVNDDTSAASMLAAAESELESIAPTVRESLAAHLDHVESGLEDVRADLAASTLDDPDLYGDALHLHRTQGFVRVALRLAFWELAHAPSFTSALIDAVNRGGDSDTNGAIAGALLGARFGQAAISSTWKNAVLACAPPGQFGDIYHPRILLSILR